MRCLFCRAGVVAPGITTVVLERGATTVVIKDVPADVCDACGEAYFSQELNADLLARAEAAVARGAEVEIVRYAA